jgi:glucosamine kinase
MLLAPPISLPPAPILGPGVPPSSPSAPRQPRWWLGVDGGGTRTRLRLAQAGGIVLADGAGGPSALGQGAAQAWREIGVALADAAANAGLDTPAWADCALAAGLSGAGLSTAARAFRAADPGCAWLVLASDGEAALQAAFDGGPGLLLIAGTGSVCEVRDADGRRATVGGWGWRHGDEGSGAWLGRQALVHTMRAHDGRDAAGALAAACASAVASATPGADVAAALQAFGDRAGQAACAALAPLVFTAAAAGDVAAEALLSRAATELDALIAAADPRRQLPIVLSGSVAERLAPRLRDDTRARCRPAAADAPAGALLWLRAALSLPA